MLPEELVISDCFPPSSNNIGCLFILHAFHSIHSSDQPEIDCRCYLITTTKHAPRKHPFGVNNCIIGRSNALSSHLPHIMLTRLFQNFPLTMNLIWVDFEHPPEPQ